MTDATRDPTTRRLRPTCRIAAIALAGQTFWVSVLCALLIPHGARAAYGDACYDDTWGSVVCADENVVAAVASASDAYGVDYDWLMSVAACENDFLWWPVGPFGELGIFQFLPDTFYGITGGSGDPQDVWDAADAAASAFADGDAGWWTCNGRV